MEFNELRYQKPSTRTYLGSPSLLRLGNGDLLATHDYFGPGAPKDYQGMQNLTSVYRSGDGGRMWENVTHISGAFWSGLFEHRGQVYLLGVSCRYGSIVIRRSEDGSNTWTHPIDGESGLLFRGGPSREPPNYHCAPMPVLLKDGRLYRAFENCDPPQWGTGFRSLVVSADADADLLEAAAWRMSNHLAYDPDWSPPAWERPLEAPGWLEGNVIETDGGDIWNVLRFNARPEVNQAAVVKVEDDGGRVGFDPETGFIELPGGGAKFTIRRDPRTGQYLTLSNNNSDPSYPRQRNVLSLRASDDLVNWRRVRTLLTDDSDLSHEESIRQVGFQYVDWRFDAEDIIYLVRTAYGGAHNYHDANRITFHRLEGFRTCLS